MHALKMAYIIMVQANLTRAVNCGQATIAWVHKISIIIDMKKRRTGRQNQVCLELEATVAPRGRGPWPSWEFH